MLPFVLVIFLFRIQMMYPILPVNHVNVDYYHGRKLWANDIRAIAHNDPVLFGNEFRESSLYSFYAGQMGVALFSGENRRSQYEVWNYEDSIQEKNVLYISKYPFAGSNVLLTRMGKTLYYHKLFCFHSFYNIPIHTNFPAKINKSNDTEIILTIRNPRNKVLNFKCSSSDSVSLFYVIKKDDKIMLRQQVKNFSTIDSIPANGSMQMKVKILTGHFSEGKYEISFGFTTRIIEDSYNTAYSFSIP
jgi:hypothetical protein